MILPTIKILRVEIYLPYDIEVKMKNNSESSPKLYLDDGMLIYDDTFIQLCNVSKINIDTAERKKIPVWIIIGYIICLFMFISHDTLALGLIGIILLLIPTFSIFMYNSDLDVFIVISLNSGEKVYFYSDNTDFLYEALNSMISSIKEGKETMINFTNCTIEGSNIIGRDVNGDNIAGKKKVENTNSNNETFIINADNDWEVAFEMFNKLLSQYKEYSLERDCIETAMNYCEKKNANKLKKYINDNKDIFKEITANVAAAGIVEVLKGLIGISF